MAHTLQTWDLCAKSYYGANECKHALKETKGNINRAEELLDRRRDGKDPLMTDAWILHKVTGQPVMVCRHALGAHDGDYDLARASIETPSRCA